MGSLNPFKKPKAPAPVVIQKPPPVVPAEVAPSQVNNAEDIGDAQEDEKQRLKKQKGRAATILTGGKGVLGDDSSGLATKKLLGG